MSDKLSVALTPPMLRIEAGGTGAILITLRNLGSEVEQYVIAVEGIDPFWYSASAHNIALAPLSQSEIQLTLRPPRTSEVKAGTYPFVVKAVSRSNPEEITAQEAVLQVDPRAGLELDLSPRTSSGQEPFRVRVANWGEAECQLALSARDREGALSFEFQPSFLALQSGQSADVQLTVRPKRGRILGRSTERDFQVMAAPPGAQWDSDESHIVTGVLIDKPDLSSVLRLKAPVKLPKAALLGAAVLVVAVLGAGAWMSTRPPASAPRVESPAVASPKASEASPTAVASVAAPAQPTTTSQPSKSTSSPTIQRFVAQRAEDRKTVMLVWDVLEADEVRLNGNAVGPSGSQPATMDRDGAYILLAKNKAGTSSSTVYVVMVCPPAILSFNVSPSSIQPGQSATLTWDSFGASQTDIDGQPRPVRGSLVVAPAQSTRYVLTSANGAGTSQAEVFLDVAGSRPTPTPVPTLPPLPTVPPVQPTPVPPLVVPTPTAAPPAASPLSINAFSGAPVLLTNWGTTTLSWNVSGATAVSIEPGIGAVGPSGTASVVVPQSTTFVLTAVDGSGQTATSSVDITTIDPPYIVSFGVPEKSTMGSSVNLAWNTTGASEIVITWNDDQGAHSTQTYSQGSGSVQVTPAVASPHGVTFTLTAKNQAGTTATAIRSMTVSRP